MEKNNNFKWQIREILYEMTWIWLRLGNILKETQSFNNSIKEYIKNQFPWGENWLYATELQV